MLCHKSKQKANQCLQPQFDYRKGLFKISMTKYHAKECLKSNRRSHIFIMAGWPLSLTETFLCTPNPPIHNCG